MSRTDTPPAERVVHLTTDDLRVIRAALAFARARATNHRFVEDAGLVFAKVHEALEPQP